MAATLSELAVSELHLPGELENVWRVVLFAALALTIGALSTDAMMGAGLRSTRLLRLAMIVLLVARAGAMAERWDQPISLWGPPFTTLALALLFVGRRHFVSGEEHVARERTGVEAHRLRR